MLSRFWPLAGKADVGETTPERPAGVTAQVAHGVNVAWDAAGNAAKVVMGKPKDMITGAVNRRIESATRRLRALVESIIQIACFFGGTVSLFFVGLFLSVGFEFSAVVDRASMLTTIFLLTCLFTSIRVVVSVLPAMLPSAEMTSSSAPALGQGLMPTSSRIVTGIVVSAFVVAVIGPGYGAAFLLLLLVGLSVFRRRRLTAQLTAALIACLCLGYLRGEHLRDQSPSLIIVEQGRPEPVPVTVIMSADRGVLVFADRANNARFVPWDKIESLSDARVTRWRLRDIIIPLRNWFGPLYQTPTSRSASP